MKYIEGESRGQATFLPECIEDYVGADNPARVIDAFVDSLDMEALGFGRATPNETGRPPYDPRDLLKLFIYGYFNRIRSSRRLMQESKRNLEVMYLIGKLAPDFRTIADFRKDNAKALRGVFRAFVKLCLKMNLYNKELAAIDGTKFRAVNSKDNAYNKEILIKKLARIDEHIAEYLKRLDLADEGDCEPNSEEPDAGQIKALLDGLNARKDKYNGFLDELDASGKTQILTTDPEAHRMHTKDGFNCCYNVQAAVDAGSHLIIEYEATGSNTDQGLLNEMSEKAKRALGLDTIEVVADKGYESREDILNCVTNGVVPNVALKYDKEERIYTLPYVENEITEKERAGTGPEDISKCLHAGVLPACYEGTPIEVELQGLNALSCFIRHSDGTVVCPMGKELGRLKARGNNTIYGSKEACRECPNRCTASKSYKTVSFGPDTEIVPVKMYGNLKHPPLSIPPDKKAGPNNHTLFRGDYPQKKVMLRIRNDKGKIKERMRTVEHPFGTVKWYSGAHYLLCKGKEKVNAEIGLSFLAYNLRRAINMVGTQKLISAITG